MNFNMSDIFKKVQYWSYGRIIQKDDEYINKTQVNVIPKVYNTEYPGLSKHYIHDDIEGNKPLSNINVSVHQIQDESDNTGTKSKSNLNKDNLLGIETDFCIYTDFNLNYY